MKLVFVSDIHGSLPAAKNALEAFARENAELLVVLGDFYYHGPRNPLPEGYDPMSVAKLFNAASDKLLAIKGNCDAEVDETISEFPFFSKVMLEADGKTFDLFHGHRAFRGADADAFVSGHTHLYGIRREGARLFVNPGSLALPKGGNPPTYAAYENGVFFIRTPDGKTIEEGALA